MPQVRICSSLPDELTSTAKRYIKSSAWNDLRAAPDLISRRVGKATTIAADQRARRKRAHHPGARREMAGTGLTRLCPSYCLGFDRWSSPDAVQRAALAAWCTADPGPKMHRLWVPA